MSQQIKSDIGRKSVYSKEISEISFNALSKRTQKNSYRCVVLDICGAHNPKTEFLNEEFRNGIYLIVGIYAQAEVRAVYWNKCYDYLRTIYGTDENIIGRECNIKAVDNTSAAFRNAEIEFNMGYANTYQDEATHTYISLSGAANMFDTCPSLLDNFQKNKSEGSGEIWRNIKK